VIAEVERALLIPDEDSPQVIAMCRFALANVLWDAPEGQGRDRARARELALLARNFQGGTGELMIDDWLRSHGGLPN
jgi:hypothetical protein